MLRAVELPVLSHVEQSTEGGDGPYFVTESGRVGLAFELPLIDAEGAGFENAFALLTALTSRLKPGAVLRFIQKTNAGTEGPKECSRRRALDELGWVESRNYLVVESTRFARFSVFDLVRGVLGKRPKAVDAEATRLHEKTDFALIRELGGVALEEAGIRSLFPTFQGGALAARTGIDAGSEVIGVVRLIRQGTHPIDEETLAELRENLIAPYEINVTVRKITDSRAQYILQRKRGQLAASTNSIAARTYEETDAVVAETVLAGKGLVELEWLFTLKRRSEAALREDLDACQRVLSALGDAYIEVQGVASGFAATIPGSDPHHLFMELDDVAPHFLPVIGRGGNGSTEPPTARALALHRRDGSLYHFDLWRRGYDGANCIINGRRGKGKSVLANLISSALLNDPSVRLVKVDVGGSYVKECEMAGGRHVQFNLSEPSGLNPFAAITQTEFTEDAAVILSGFLSTLILESHEVVLSKELLGEVERAVLAYTERRSRRPSLSHFLEVTKDFPRRGLLERFGPSGIFANVLKERQTGAPLVGAEQERYVYFNFERLQNAANEDFAQAVMAAVIAATNMEVLRAGDARCGAKSKVVFFADETPFFIQRNGRFFKLTTANFRKFGHGTILIAQTTKDFELSKEGGETDCGILINSPIRFFYQVDDDPDVFAKKFGLTARQVADIQGLGRSAEYREVFLQDELGGRVLRVAVTSEEYWRVTSSRSDNEKIHALLAAVPGLTLQEAIRCLGR
jgi:hypothetical protein